MKNHDTLNAIASILLIIGGLNWGIIGWLNIDPIDAIFGGNIGIPRGIFFVIGLAAIYKIIVWNMHAKPNKG